MSIYIHRNGQQFGPFEEQQVIDQLSSGQFSPDDMGIRQGETDWKKLSAMFPNAAPTQAPFAAIPPPPVPEPEATAPVQHEAVYRGTTMQKMFFGLCFLVAVVGFGAAAFYLYTLWGPTGDLQADLSRGSYRVPFQYLATGTLVGSFFALLAFALTFKRKLIRSNGPRIALRVIFILILLVGLGNIGFAAFTYLTYNAPVISSTKSESNELLRTFEQGKSAVAPAQMAMVFSIGAGLFLFGLSGILMTKKLRTE